MEEIGLSLDSSNVERGTKKTLSALDSLITALEKLESAATSMSSRTEGELNKALTQIKSFNKRLGATYESMAQSAKEGTMEYPQLVRAQNQAVQMAYEARLASEIAIGNQELQFWRSQNVQLGALQKTQLKQYEDNLKEQARLAALQSATYIKSIKDSNAAAVEVAKAADVGRDYAVTSAARKAALIADAEAFAKSPDVLAAMSKYYTAESGMRTAIASRAKAEARMQFQANSDAIKSEALAAAAAYDSSAEKMISMKQYYSLEASMRANIAAKAKLDAQAQFKLNSEAIRAESTAAANAYARSPETLANMSKYYTLESSMRANIAATAQREAREMFMARSAAIKAENDRMKGDNSREMSILRSQYANASEGGNLAVQAAMESLRSTSSKLRPELDKLGPSAESLSNGFKRLASDGNDVHSMARGLASGFGALWLTWGNLAPLFIGAAISNGFMQTAKAGMEVAHTLKIIEVLGGNTADEMQLLTKELDNISKTGPAGPIQVAEAMKVLSLAGLKANEIIAVTRDVLNFSVAGNTGIEKAASTLMAVSTAFSMGSEGFSQVADVISKASAVSMTSVESFSSAMKTASVINAQYGVSLEDTAIAIAAMSQLGIEGTAAGTALRNMYSDLSGRSQQVAKVLRSQGIEMRDVTTGAFKPLIQVVGELNTKMQSLDAISQKNIMQSLLSERGAKGIVELLRLINSEAKNTGAGLQNALVEAQKEIADNAGFSAIAAAKLNQTAQKQFEAVKATMVSSMVEVYREVDPTMILIADRLKTVFASEEFKSGLSTLVASVAEFTATLVENSKVIGYAALAYGVLKTVQMGTVAVLGLANAASMLYRRSVDAETIAVNVNTAAQVENAAARTGALASLGVFARSIPAIGTAIAVLTGVYLVFDAILGRSNDSAKTASEVYNTSMAKDLKDQNDKLESIIELRKSGLSIQEAEMRLATMKSVKPVKDEIADLKTQIANEELLGDNDVRVIKRLKEKLSLKEEAMRVAEEAANKEIARAKELATVQNAMNAKTPPTPTGTGTFDARDLKATSGAEAFTSILKTLNSETAALRAEQAAGTSQTTEWTNIQKTAAKELEGLKETYENSTRSVKDLSKGQLDKISTDYKEAQSASTLNKTLRVQNFTRKEVETALLAQLAIEQKLLNDQETFRVSQANKYNLPAARDAAMASLKISQDYNEAVRKSELATQAKLDEAGGDPTRIMEVLRQRKLLLANLSSNKTEASALEQTKIYQQAWDTTINSIASNFSSQLMNGTLNVKDFMVQTFASTVLMPQLQMLTSSAFSSMLGGAGGWFSALAGTKSFEGGGYTGSGSRSGGMDGKGGFLAMVHPNETVVDHTKGQSSGSAPVYITISNTVGDVATKSMLDQANAATVKQIQAGLNRSMRYNGVMSRG